MEQKEKDENKTSEINPPPAKNNNNKVLFWILGGCLALLVITGLITAGFLYWGYKKINQAASDNKRQIEERQNEMKKIEEAPQNISAQTKTSVPEPPQAISEEPPTNNDNNQSAEGMRPFSGEKQIGYIKKVYTKGGKNYLNIDYIQWLTGAEAQKAMQEDGQCPKTGECIVFDDYYIRNVNPLIRTFEIAADAEITMQTYDMEETGLIQPQKISFAQFSWIFTPKVNSRLKDVPYIVEISSNQIVKINEQYIP